MSRRESRIHYEVDTRHFDFEQITSPIDVVFIDGNHAYEGIKSDTDNVQKLIDFDNSIVIWHDFRTGARRHYRHETVQAVFDSIPSHYHDRLYYIDLTMCGAYIPPKYVTLFKIEPSRNEIANFEIRLACNILTKP